MRNFRIEHKINQTSENGFDIRIVSYEEIHNILKEDFDKLVKVIDPKDNEIILDGGAGYGAVTREILFKTKNEKKLHIYLLDISPVQLKRATYELEKAFNGKLDKVKLSFIHDSLVYSHCKELFFDKIICKMVIHEIPYKFQQLALNDMFRILKNDGTLIIWDLMLDKETQLFFQKIMQKKDELAGYISLAENRYFLREEEWTEILKNAGFEKVKKETDVLYELHTKMRLKHEFNDDEDKLFQWNNFIRNEVKKISEETEKKIKFLDLGDDIIFFPPKSIYSARK